MRFCDKLTAISANIHTQYYKHYSIVAQYTTKNPIIIIYMMRSF